jgi:hypothetical protein
MRAINVLLLLGALGLAASPSQVDGKDDLEKCLSVRDDAQRLACFDAYALQVESQETAESKAADVHEGPAQSTEEKKVQDNFGLTVSEIADREAEIARQRAETDETDSKALVPEKPVPEALVARVETFTRLNRSNKIRITLDNGQVWQEIDGAAFRGSVQPGAEVTITERRFGGYKMSVPGRSSVILVRRLQ